MTFDAFTFAFEKTDAGWIWAHAYRFADDCSTFIVECSEKTWAGLGFDQMDQAQTIQVCERLFAKYLGGAPLLTNAAHLRGSAAWLKFRRIICERWHYDRLILLGDAAHTAHFSIGSGTKLALEDAIKLAEVLNRPGATGSRPGRISGRAELKVLKLQNSARNSTEWFETVERYLDFEPWQFAYSLLTRSQRISHENLRLRDPEWLEQTERTFWKNATGKENRLADVRTIQAAGTGTAEPHRGLADGHVLRGRRRGGGFPPRASRRAGSGRRRIGLHGNDLPIADGPHHARLRRHAEGRACRRVEADHRLRPCQ